MELAGILLVTCVLVLSAPSASAESRPLLLLHAYPGNNTNFSYIELTCLHENPESQSLAVGAHFQLNGTDIEEGLSVTYISDGTIHFILTPEKEGFFTCSLNGSLSNNSIGLAGQPSSDYSERSQSVHVELQDADSVVSTELQCDIQPGALRQRYSVQWKQMFSDSYATVVNEDMFNLTLNVSSSLNGSQYQCEVTIDHDGSNIRNYDGVLVTLVTDAGGGGEKQGSPSDDKISTLTIVAVTITVSVVCTCSMGLGCLFFTIRKKGSSTDVETSTTESLLPRNHPRKLHNQLYSTTTNIHEELEMNLTSEQAADSTSRFSDVYNLVEDEEFLSSRDASPLIADPVSLNLRASSIRTLNPIQLALNQLHGTCHSPAKEQSFSPPQARSALTLPHMPCSDRHHRRTDNKNYAEEDRQVTSQPENRFLPPYSGDLCYNTAQHIPRWLNPVATLIDCTSDGRSYYDEHNDFHLEIPDGAIPEGERVTIDIGVALYGPFQYPEGLRPVSPVFWVCVRGREKFHFLKPVKITIEHCLSLDRHTDIHSLGLTVLKGDHSESTNQKYLLKRLQGDEKCEFIANDNHAVLHTNHFCYQCIVSKISKEAMERADFGILVLTPKEFGYSKPVLVYFFVMFLLEACLETVEKQIEKRKEFKGIAFDTRTLLFTFQKGEDNPVIKLQWERTLPGGWSIELPNVTEIAYKDVDFYGINPECLKTRERCGLYPPRFVVSIDGSSTTMKAVVNFTFSGALTNKNNDDLKYPMQLLPQSPQPIMEGTGLRSPKLLTPPPSRPDSGEPITLKLGIKELHDVFLAVVSLAGRWNKLGLALGLYQPHLAKIKVENSDMEDCLLAVLTNWLNQMYNVRRFEEPSWPVLMIAVACPAGGRNPALALDIAQKYKIPTAWNNECY